MTAPTVYGVVVTHNRKRMLLECLAALRAQGHSLSGVLVVDNASTDGTFEELERGGFSVDYLRLERNGGGAEGFHYGVRHAREAGCDWIWLMDDDCAPEPDALEKLLASPKAADPATAVLAPLVLTTAREVLPLNRGWVRPRWFRAPLIGLSREHWVGPETEVGYVSLVGPLVRTEVARRTDPPRRELFIWFDDLEWMSRLAQLGRMWLVPASRFVHKDERPLPDTSALGLLRDLARGQEFRTMWKRAYGLRNILWCGRRDGYFNRMRALSFVAVAALRALLSGPPRTRSLRLTLTFARDGWQGRFRNLPPERWPALGEGRKPLRYLSRHALRYDAEVDGEVRRLRPQRSAPREA
jgi:rhamnopyranosyl-N-acetylglucosaminyl-diphospho-decaprenol beta-1,3/1,4-galactofuranosyltransferase